MRSYKVTRLRIVTAIAIVIALFLSFRETKLRIAVNQGVESVALKKIIATYASMNNVSIEVTELPYDRLYESEMGAVADQKNPKYDVIMLDDPWMPAIIGEGRKNGGENAGGGMPRPRLMKLQLKDCNDFFEATLKICRYPYDEDAEIPKDCKQDFYALPFVGNSQLFMYSTETYEQPPSKWSDVVSRDYVMRVGAGNQIVTDFVPMAWETAKSSVESKDPVLSFRTKHIPFQGSMEAFNFIETLGRKGVRNLSIISQDDFDLAILLAKTKASAAIIWSAWAMQMANLPEAQRTESFGKLRFGPIPGGMPVLGAWLLAVPGNSRQGEIAKKFVKFATEPKQIAFAASNGNPPPLKSVLNDLKGETVWERPTSSTKQSEPFADLFSMMEESLETGIPRPRTPHWKKIESAVGTCLSLLYGGAISPKTAMERSNWAITNIEALPPEFSCEASVVPREIAGP